MLVTGRTVLVDADHGDELVEALNAQMAADGLAATRHYAVTDHPRVLEVVGAGPDWSSATYVRLLTEVLESGATRCLVGTRGLFGDGWDALSLNALVDLTSVTTSTGTRQLRGRSMRLDPRWPTKLAHNWDVICVAPDHPRGDVDLRRLARRHAHLWGIVPPPRLTTRVADAVAVADAAAQGAPVEQVPGAGIEVAGEVARGVLHLSPELATDLAFRPWSRIRFGRHTRASRAAVGTRARSHAGWDVGGEIDRFETRATRIDVRDLRIRTVTTVTDTLRAVWRRVGVVLLSAVARRSLARPSCHAVPDLLGVNRERAEAFAAAWGRHVGGGELTYTRTEEGRRALLAARTAPSRHARSYAFDRWR